MTQIKSVAHSDMRNMNISLILDHVRRHAPLSRSKLAKMTGLNKATVSNIVRELIKKRFIIELGTRDTKATIGPPSIDLDINPNAGWIIGAEIGNNSISVILTDLSPRILWRRFQKTAQPNDLDAVLAQTLNLLTEAYAEGKKSDIPILGLGLAVPGLVDISTGTLLFTPYQNWRDVPLLHLIESQIDVPIYIGNKAHMAALGESYFGTARDSDFVLYINAGFSLSSGIVLYGDVLPGTTDLAGEVGHMTVDPNGLRCQCGNIGCWETTANQQALHRRIQGAIASGQDSSLIQFTQGNLNELSLSLILEAADSGDEVALNALEETGYWLGIGIANLINILNPQMVVFGGTLSTAHKYLLPTIQEVVAERSLHWAWKSCDIKLTAHKKDAGVFGAIATVYWGILNYPYEFLHREGSNI